MLLCCHESDEEHTYTSSDLVSTIVLQQAPPWKEEGGQSSTVSLSMQTWILHGSQTGIKISKLLVSFFNMNMFPALPPLSDIVCGCSRPLHTWVCVDPSVQPSAASLLSLLDGCSSGPALSDRRGWRSQLQPEKHSLPLWSDSLTGCRHTKQHRNSERTAMKLKLNVSKCWPDYGTE